MRIGFRNLITPAKRIEKAIELLVHYNLTLIEIAYQLNYESADEFENQFRNWVGCSPEDYRQLILGEYEMKSGVLSRL